jgi:hypothetical protein
MSSWPHTRILQKLGAFVILCPIALCGPLYAIFTHIYIFLMYFHKGIREGFIGQSKNDKEYIIYI